ncbi:MAG: restriction endonuclease subunit S [Clostridiales bacterium]|nr:restriction endonuclease subunit S [Clostridiales bacterium]
MTLTNDLKQSIYMAAVSGKLTETLNTDTPIEDYIQQLKDEKEVAGGVRKARKGQNIDEITETEIPCDIPATWRYVRIIDAVKSISAGGDKPSNFSKEKTEQYLVPVISNGETNMGIFGYTDIPSVSELALTVSGRGTIGYSVIRNEPFVPIVRLLVILPLKGTNLQYIQLTLSALIEFGSGTAVKQLTVPMISPKVIPLPPPEEQQRIVDRVNELLAKVDEFEKIENRLTAVKEKFPSDLRAAILQAAMQGKLTEQLDTDSSVDDLLEEIKPSEHPSSGKGKRKSKSLNIEFFDIPETWRWVKLSECGTTNIGLTYSPSDVSLTDGTIVLRSSNIQNGAMDYNDIVRVNMTIPENKMCHIGDILICARNGSKRLVGKSAIIDKEGMAFGAFMAIYRSKCNPYINYVLESPHFRKSVLGGAETTTINQVTQDMLENYMFPLPPIEEQQRIVERLDALLPLCDELAEE